MAKKIEAGKSGKSSGGNDMSKLSPMQERFVIEYLIDLNQTQAAIRAGYSPKTANEQASRLLTRVHIQSRVQQEMDKRAEKTGITAEYVLKTIKETIERCKQAEPVFDRKGQPTGEYQFDSSAVLKGSELLGKHLKLFTDKVEHSGEVKLSIEELLGKLE